MRTGRSLFAVLALGLILSAPCAAAQAVLPIKSGTSLRTEASDSAPVAASLDGVAKFDWTKARVVRIGDSQSRGELTVLTLGIGTHPDMPADLWETNKMTTRVSYLLPSIEASDHLWLALETPAARGWAHGEEARIAIERDWPVPPEAPVVIPLVKKELPRVREGFVPRVTELFGDHAQARCEFTLLINPKGEVEAARVAYLSGVPGLETHLEPVLRRWKFGKASVEGKPAYILVRLRLEFTPATGRLGEKP